ncbi:MAG: 2-dehydropantoate 2-reductase [bacterium]|nr:2-dehydropantoate 2-reductase [bacterium]
MKNNYKVSIIGMGALGMMYGSFITEHAEEAIAKKKFNNITVDFVLDEQRYERNKGKEITCNGKKKAVTMTKASEATPCDLLIVATKATGLEAALATMENCVDDHTTIISVLNGITSEEILGERFGKEKIIYTVAQGMDAMKFGNQLNYSNMGKLCIGIVDPKLEDRLQQVEEFFDAIQMSYVEEKDILYRMWSKFMLNVGVNQTCMVYNTNYKGVLTTPSEENRMLIAAMREVVAVANAEGIGLTEKDLSEYVRIIGTLNPTSVPSMAQDRINGKRSEVESFAGTVRRLARKHDIYVPANDYLYERIMEIEREIIG